jgi:DNA-binding NarL/FixJ family response regulator
MFVAAVAADPAALRRVLAALGSGGIATAASGGSVKELVVECADVGVDVVVCAVDDPRDEFTAMASLLRWRMPEARVVVVAQRLGPLGLRAALEAGADGVMLARDVGFALVSALEVVCAGQSVVPGELRTQIQPPALSKRQEEILELMDRGMTNREIGDRLYLAESTVKSSLSAAFRKLGVRSRTEARARLRETRATDQVRG